MTTRVYLKEQDGIALGVTIFERAELAPLGSPAESYKAIADQLREAGGEDAKVSRIVETAHQGLQGTDGTITFTSTQGDSSYWRLRTLIVGDDWVRVTAQIFADPEDASAQNRVDSAFARLVASVAVTTPRG